MSRNGIALALVMLIAGPVFAGFSDDGSVLPEVLRLYLTPDSVQVQQIQEPQAIDPEASPVDDCRNPRILEGDSLIGDFTSIVAVGEKLWKLIEMGRPVVSFKAPVVHALPPTNLCWSDLEKWQAPKSTLWETVYRNAFGKQVVRFRFRLVYTAGGSLDGKGKYLANVTVQPANLEVSWGYTFNAETTVGRAFNTGTKDDPIAGLQIAVGWNIKTLVKDGMVTENFFVQGNGDVNRF